MGRHFQRRDDHRGRNRSSRPSLRNPGTEHPELPHGTSQEESGCWLGVRRSKVNIDDFFNNKNAAANGLWKKPAGGRGEKPKAGFPPIPPPGFFHSPDCCWYLSNNIGKSN